jgi:methyl-accepting chemotaxis protein
MIKKIKELMETKEEINVIKNNLNYTTTAVSELKEEITSLKEGLNSNLDEINHKSTEVLKNFEENMNTIKDISHNFEKEFFQFKLLKSQMQKKLMEKFEEELDKELKLQSKKLESDAEVYQELKENIKDITSKVNNLGDEINKFIEISQTIKKEDFEMTRFANKLKEMDREKLDLMKKLDTMERLVSKMRRQEQVIR